MDQEARDVMMEALAMAYFSVAGSTPRKGDKQNLVSPIAFSEKTLKSLEQQDLIRYNSAAETVEVSDEAREIGSMLVGGMAIMLDKVQDMEFETDESSAGADILQFPGRQSSASSAPAYGPGHIPLFDPAQYRPLTEKRGFLFRITLELEDGYECWREVLMPANCSFLDLHLAIQIAFDWDDAHLFDFKMNARGQKIHIDEASFLDPALPPAVGPKEAIVEADDIFLSDVFPKSRTATYTYDYGDDWTHKIKLVKTYPSCPVERPTLVAGVGQAPPEDVGGAWGFEDFLKVLADKKHPEHKDMSEWAKDMGWKKNFDLEETKELLEEDFYVGRVEWNYRLGLEQ